jgi:hypothetical protein
MAKSAGEKPFTIVRSRALLSNTAGGGWQFSPWLIGVGIVLAINILRIATQGLAPTRVPPSFPKATPSDDIAKLLEKRTSRVPESFRLKRDESDLTRERDLQIRIDQIPGLPRELLLPATPTPAPDKSTDPSRAR